MPNTIRRVHFYLDFFIGLLTLLIVALIVIVKSGDTQKDPVQMQIEELDLKIQSLEQQVIK